MTHGSQVVLRLVGLSGVTYELTVVYIDFLFPLEVLWKGRELRTSVLGPSRIK